MSDICPAGSALRVHPLDGTDTGTVLFPASPSSLTTSSYKGNAQYPYRVHPKLLLKAIPTLYRWGKQGPVGSLVEGQILDVELLGALVEDMGSSSL